MTHAARGWDDSRPGHRFPCGTVVPTTQEWLAGQREGTAVASSLRFITCPQCHAWAAEQRWPAEPGEKQMRLGL